MSLPKPYFHDKDTTVYCAKCEDILPHLGKFDLLLTDPKYGINAARHRNSQANGWRDYDTKEESGWDEAATPFPLLQQCIAASAVSIVWGGNYFPLHPSMGWLIWNKMQRDFSLADGEMAWTSENRAMRIFDYARARVMQDGKVHPTQKPVNLMLWCLGMFPAAKTCLDPFGGSLTTAVACKLRGVHCVTIEQNEKYCALGVERLRQGVLITA